MRRHPSRALSFLALLAALPLVGGACARQPDAATARGADAAALPEDAPRLFDGLGGHHHPVTTDSALAQRYFDQGLAQAYGFNHDAAIRSFEAARALDPECAMCAWGVAYALGPNINAPMGPDAARRAHAAAQEALALASGASERERAYIEAMTARYAAEPPEDRADLDRAYANAMREVHRGDPQDADAATLFAESLMDLSPWNYWTSEAEPRAHTRELLAALEGVLAREPGHLGANHFYIHAVEEHHPERAVAAADRLGELAPDAGHLVHMPSHIYWRVGRYDDALEINRRAAAADESFFATCRAGAFYRAVYYPHNVHFLWAAAAAEGRSQIAITAARKLQASVVGSLDEFDFVEEFASYPVLTLVRFGRWDAVLGEPRPARGHPYLTGTWHYARGLARVRRGELALAHAELEALATAAALPAARALVLGGGTATAADLLAIGRQHLAGELAAAEGDAERAVAALREAVALQDRLVYMEPPQWYFPTRQALGAVLLEAGRAERAEAVYRRDLEQYPANGWSLYGLSESLRAQGKLAEAEWARKGHATAWARADVDLDASRF